MRVLFDNNVPAPLRRHLTGYDVRTARETGWHEIENGRLLTAAEDAGFDVFVTGDKNLSYQQNLKGRNIALVVLGTIRWSILRKEIGLVLEAMKRAKQGSFEALPAPRLPRRLRPSSTQL